MARHSWYHICEVLGTHNFDEQGEPQPFTQKTVREFVHDVGYRKARATDDVAIPEITLAARSKATSIVASSSNAASFTVHEGTSKAYSVKPPLHVSNRRTASHATPAAPPSNQV